MLGMQSRALNEAALLGRLEAQRLVQATVRSMEVELLVGVTEAQIAALLRARLVEAGAEGFFHEPVIWFGERSALRGMKSHSDAMPGETKLCTGDAVLMDVAPFISGFPIDVSWTSSCGENQVLERGRTVLKELREVIPEWVTAGKTRRELAVAVEDLARERGFASRQKAYLFGALGHRLYGPGLLPFARRSSFGLGLGSSIQLFGTALMHRLSLGLVEWPFWNDSAMSETRPGLGVWSVEPHIASDGVGAKWEELLLVEEHGARWLESAEPLI